MLSESLKAKFDRVIARYPLKRSAIVPLLLFAQDEIGYVSDEAVDEIARRVEVHPIEVIEDIGYYSMLRRQPVGKHRINSVSHTSRRRRTESSRSKRWNASGRVVARQRCR